MFNYGAIDKTPSIAQVRAIIKYIDEHPSKAWGSSYMITMDRVEPDKIVIDINDAHTGYGYTVLFEGDEIISFEGGFAWMS